MSPLNKAHIFSNFSNFWASIGCESLYILATIESFPSIANTEASPPCPSSFPILISFPFMSVYIFIRIVLIFFTEYLINSLNKNKVFYKKQNIYITYFLQKVCLNYAYFFIRNFLL